MSFQAVQAHHCAQECPEMYVSGSALWLRFFIIDNHHILETSTWFRLSIVNVR
jgi:hypothetical protein